jgi:putative addiction module component (TIGR02574 family)
MMNKPKTLTEQARALPLKDRIALVEDVLDSLDHTDPDLDRLWAREASDRLAAYRRGELAAKELGDLIAKIPAVTVRFLEIAEIELDQAIEWYGSQAPGLGNAFLIETRPPRTASRYPKTWHPLGEGVHRFRLSGSAGVW